MESTLWNIVCMYTFKIMYTYKAEKAMAPHSSTLAWKIPWTEEPGGLQSMGSLQVGHKWATSLSLFTFMHWRRKWQPTQYSCLENPRDRGAWWAAVYGVTQSRIRVKWLSSSSIHKQSRMMWTKTLIVVFLGGCYMQFLFFLKQNFFYSWQLSSFTFVIRETWIWFYIKI